MQTDHLDSGASCSVQVPPTSQPVLATEADCVEADMAMHRYKTNGGIQRYEQERAMRLQMADKSGRYS